MKLWSDSWANGDRIAARFAAGKLEGATGVAFSDNRNPHRVERVAGGGTKSLVLICHDFDAEQARRRQPARPRNPE